jgi:hypothetical protein
MMTRDLLGPASPLSPPTARARRCDIELTMGGVVALVGNAQGWIDVVTSLARGRVVEARFHLAWYKGGQAESAADPVPMAEPVTGAVHDG